MTLVLVRHGESAGNVGGVIQGWSDAALTETGTSQAEAVASRLTGRLIAAVYTSPLQRARATARPIADRAGIDLTELAGLRERNYGEAQGLTWSEAAARWPVGEAAHDRDWASGVPGVESIDQLRNRAVDVVEELLDRHSDDIAVCVSHGGTLVQIIAHFFGLPAGTWPRIRMSNASVTIVEGTSARPVITMLNDICHLDDPSRARRLAL
ncbi:MAG: histidine phosphatase family protein [Dehalococcoidia bacterium]